MYRAVFRTALAATAITCVAVIPVPTATAVGATDLHATVRSTMLAQHGAASLSAPVREPLVEPTRTAGNWVFGSTTIPLWATDEHQAPKMALFLAHRERSGWRVELDSTKGFTELAATAPRSVLSDGERQTFTRHQTAAISTAAVTADTGLGLPWPQGVSWSMGGGPHGNSGSSRPFNSIDFNGGNGQVLAAGPGRVYKSCIKGRSALVKVVHDNGYSTTYYHMTSLTTLADGSPVTTTTHLGNIGNELPCGGSSSGAHVHFSLLRGNTAVSVHGMKIGGWTFNEGSAAYGGYAERNGTQVRPGGGRIINYGPGTGTPPSENPTGTVDAGSNSTVNLRSGPALTYSIVGTVADGAVVSIVCTATGGNVEGVWGPTTLWNKLTTGNWISDGFVDTGSNEPVAPTC